MAIRFTTLLFLPAWPCLISGLEPSMKQKLIRQDPTTPAPLNATNENQCSGTVLADHCSRVLGTKEIGASSPPLDPVSWVDDLNRYTYGHLPRGSDDREAPSDKFIRPFARCGLSIKEFNNNSKWVTLDFDSRRDSGNATVPLHAFHMTSKVTISPTVIIVHDNKKSSGDYTVQSAAGILRLMNFNVLILQLRIADPKYEKFTQDAMYDILGAWDFVTTGIGQKQNQIAILGFGLGAYLSKMAFGFDRRIQGLLVNGGVEDLSNLMVYQSRYHTCAKADVEEMLRTNYGYNTNTTPQVLIKRNENHRHIGIHHFQDDRTVPISHSQNFESHVKKLGYRVSTWYPTAEYSGCHSNMYLLRPYDSATKLCEFFTNVFGKQRSWCDLKNMQDKCQSMAYSGAMQWKPFWQIIAIVPILTTLYLF